MSDPYREPIEEKSSQPPKIEKPVPLEIREKAEKEQETPAVSPAQEIPKVTPSPVATGAAQASKTAASKKEDLKDLDKEHQLKVLVDLALQQGIEKAVAAAKATGDAYLIDQLHDTLIDELRQQLIEKGKLKEE
jgi:hypothetical protein